MNAKLSSLKSHFLNWREWEFNPIVIKELRQSVRSWTVTGMLLLFLTVMFITSLGFLVSQSFDGNPNQELGGAIFQTFVGILTFSSVIFIPLYLGIRIAVERMDSNPDLLYISTLTPGSIIRGKFFCGAYMAVLFFSACLPFMAFTNLLRGVDLPTVFFILICLFLIVCAVNMLAIFLACLPMSRPFRILIALYGLGQSVMIIFPLVFASYRMTQSGIGAMMASPSFWLTFLTYGAIGLSVVGLLYFLSVALISPPSANRARPLRLYITAMWFLGGLVSVVWVAHEGNSQLMLPWAVYSLVMMTISTLVTISNQDQLSLRVRSKIPQAGMKRIVAFIFFNGAAGGFIWVASISIITFLSTIAVASLITGSSSGPGGFQNEFTHVFPAVMAYVFAYALTALLIHRKFLAKRPPKIAGILMVLLAGLWAIAPGIVLFFLNKLSWTTMEGLQLGNVFNVLSMRDEAGRNSHLIFALGWLFVMVLLNARWFIRQFKNFRPLQRDALPPVITETTAISK
ncbi:MAG: hypothetical protein WDN00_08760 [Limisphaerales bacterium]